MLKIKNKKMHTRLRKLRAKQIAILSGGVLLLIAAFFVLKPFLLPTSYDLSRAGFLLPSTSQSLTDKIKYDAAKKTYTLDNGQAAASSETRNNGTQNVRVTAHQNASQGVTVSDPTNSVDFTIKPKFSLLEGRQNGGHIVYPLRFHDGLLVYTMQGAGVKENILLNHSPGDSLNLDYTLELGANLEARLERDGSIGVYGNTLLSGDISTGSEADAALLKKARENADKNTLLFRIPKPYVLGPDHKPSEVQSAYKLDKNKLTLAVSGLSKASYPLAIDPSIYVASAEQFMAGNNETNINFNVANSLIEKGRTTGARFDSWTATTTLPQATWGAASVAAGGFVYTVGGTTFEKQLYTAQGASTFVVPAGVTSITTKAWGGGGGGGAGGSAAAGGTGGGAGYVTATYTVTPGETLNVYVGGGGAAGTRNTAGGGGGGGGYSSLYRSTTPLAIAAGGAGGGGGRNSAGHTGGAGGAGGGTSGIAGSASGIALGGGLGSPSTFGLGGTGGNNPGSNGAALIGGLGADGRTSAGADGSGAIGGLATGGDGGSVQNTARSGGGGGSAGWYGGGGGSGSTSGTGAGGGGGGSSMTDAGATGVTNSAGSGISPGNSGDSERGTAGNGGTAGASGGVGSAGANGLVIISYGSGGTKVSSTVNWAQFNTSTGTIDSANPGNGACSSWCTDSAYNLPAARTNLSLVAYSGFLYAFGGVDGTGTRQNSVYIAKLGANGEPQKWHPTDTNKNNWVYWYQDTNLSSIRSDASAVAYNNRMYLIGGRSTSGPVSTVEIASINPTGTLGTWTSSTALSSNLYGHSAQVYNDHLYVVGGAITVGGAPQTTVRYTNVNSDGTLNSWNTTTPLTTGRMSAGGNFTAVWGAYLYVSGGCSAVNGSGYCSTIRSDTEVASINTDGTLDVWNTVGGVSSTRTSASVITWRDKIYAIGGCSTQNTTTGDCNGSGAMLNTILYGSINRDGDASTVGATVDTSTAPCSTLSTDCNLPGTTYIGNMLTSSVVTNGYLYVIGGCTNNTCSTTTGNVAYTAISSTGHMTAPTCNAPNNLRGNTWCVDTTNAISGGLAAASPVVFGGRLYLVGGLNGTSNTGTILRTTLNTNGSIGAWTSQTMSGLSVNSVSYLYSFARANPSDVANNPGNLYIFGGCSTSSAAGCTAYSQNVYKCNIVQTTGAIASCSTGSQLQIGTIPGDTQTGLGIMSGTVYANYVYLIGGVSPNLVDLKTVRYAKIDNSNNIVTAGASGWTESPKQMEVGRRRAAAFGYNGYIYAVGGYEASTGVLADIEFIKVNVSDGSLGSATEGFTVSAVTINQRWGLTVPVSNSFAYVIGGCTAGASPGGCSNRTDTIQTFQIYNNDSGAPAGFSTSTNTYSTSPNRIGASATVLGGRIYVAGGCTSATDCTAATSNISYATIDISGNLSTSWSSTTSSLPEGRAWGQLETVGGYLYYIGGQVGGGARRSTIYYANPDSVTGDIAASPGWLTTSGGIGDTPTGDPVVRSKFSATVWNGRIYVVGGESAVSNNLTTIYKTPYMPSGGDIAVDSWAYQNNTLPVGRSGATAVAYANNLYVLGGFNGTNYFNDVMYAQIDNSGTIGSWNYTTSLPNAVAYADGFAANGYIYLVGGRTAATVCDPSMLVAPISANTTIASGNNPTGVGEWYMTNQRYTGARYGAAAVYYDGKAYVLGGGCGSTLTYASPVTQQTTLLSQPQVAKYSIRIDTDSDVFPNQWLLNGVDNSIGANWQLKYRSMPNTTTSCVSPAMTTWGRETNFGDVTLGLPGVYTPKDASGATTNCARFYYFNVTVDSSQAFGYPDDVSRGPTITDLTLQFTADPSKRLMHGRTFTGGIQQPDDTPYYTY